MDQLIEAPDGQSHAWRDETCERVSTGWRSASVGLIRAEQHARAGQGLAVSKSKAFVAVKRVGAHIGLKASDMMLLDTLGAFTQMQDWEEGRRPIVWPSNAYLMDQTGFSLSALKRHARRLAEVGVIAFKDSPNGKRWGRRNAESAIVEAYGFDLSPLSARFDEFEDLYKHLKAERGAFKQIKRLITVSRRRIRSRLEGAFTEVPRGVVSGLRDHFERLLASLPCRNHTLDTLEQLLGQFEDLRQRVDTLLFEEISSANTDVIIEKTDPKEVGNEPHLPTTNQLNSVTSNCYEEKDESGIEMRTVIQACPEFKSWAHNLGMYLTGWADVYNVAGRLRPMIGITDAAWHEAQDSLGKQMATAALVLVFEKHCSGEVTSAGGYLRGIVAKAKVGALHLERSFYGRLKAASA